MRWPALLTIVVLTYGVLGYALLFGWSLVDALYMTLITLTTVGFGEIRELTPAGRIFTMSLLLGGVTLVILTLSLVATAIAEGGLRRSRRRRMEKRIDLLRDHYIVAAYGRVGRTVVEELGAEGVPLLVIDKSEEKEENLLEDGVTYLIGDATHEDVLIAARLQHARALICAVDSDAENIFITLVARSMNPNVVIVGRTSQEASSHLLEKAGADRVFSPYVTGGREMANAALKPRVLDYMELGSNATSNVRLDELLVGSKLDGKQLGEIRGHDDATRRAPRRRRADRSPCRRRHAGARRHLASCRRARRFAPWRSSLPPVDPCIVTCALSGVAAGREQCPAIPYTPEDYASETRRARDAGASVVHIHARYPDGRPSFRVEEYRAITEAILAEVPDIIVNYSTGAVGIPMEERVHHITALKPELGALNMGSMNYAKYSPKRKSLVFDFVFANPFSDITFLLDRMNQAGVKPECECFDSGHVGNVGPLLDMGLIRPPIQYSLIVGVLGGAPATPETVAYLKTLLVEPHTWEVIAIGRGQWRCVSAAAALGGNVRVGLEDNFYLPPGEMASSNGELVAAATSIVTLSGREVAGPGEARRLLGLADPPDRSAFGSVLQKA